jgi:LysR family glycine cleavage system transcriptional activator
VPSSDKRQKLVHLNALRAFEAAARHLSFAAAADELSVTASAISQQIQTLEEYLGASLFVRAKNGLVLTPAARDAYSDIRDGLAQLGTGLTRLRGVSVDNIVTMTVMPSFAAKWLLPRIDRFRTQHPEVEVRLDTTGRVANLVEEGIDIGIRYGLGGYPGLVCEKLVGESVFPVCSPVFAAAEGGQITLLRLASMPLIHDTTIDFDPSFPDWRTWFAARGMTGLDLARGLRLSSSLLTIQAAIDGQGVALARSVLVDEDLRAGRLIRVFDDVEPTQCAYHVVYPEKALARAKVRAMRDWLLEEIRT